MPYEAVGLEAVIRPWVLANWDDEERVTRLNAVVDLILEDPHNAPNSHRLGSPELWLWSVADNRDLPLTNLGARINAFSWSPDGHSIAFSALRYGQFDVWTVAVPSGEIRRLTTDERYELYPTWTPDSRSIVYVRSDDRWADHDVMVMTASGDHQRVLTHDADMFDYGTIGTRSRFGYVQVSPDGLDYSWFERP